MATVIPPRKSVFNFNEVETKQANPSTFNMLIKDVLRANDGACYTDMERFLLPPGISGSKNFDQAYAVSVLLDHDARLGGKISVVLESQGLSRRLLWDRLQSVLRNVGFRLSHGRLVGLLEDHSKRADADENENGQPDID